MANPGTQDIKDIKAAGRKSRSDKFKAQCSDVVLCIKRLVVTLIGLSLFGLGLYAVNKGWTTPETLKHYAFTISGVCAVIDGLYVIYYALVKIK